MTGDGVTDTPGVDGLTAAWVEEYLGVPGCGRICVRR